MPKHPSDWYKLPLNFARMESRGSTEGLRPEITTKLGLIQDVFRHYRRQPNYQIVITAGQDWNPKHKLYSFHHTGFAVDIRTSDLPDGACGHTAQLIASELKRRLGAQYYVLLHKPPDEPHIHVQFRFGVQASSPGDWGPGPGQYHV